jgi:hypothetical protein
MNANRDVASLERFERWMQAVIVHPDGVAAGVAEGAPEFGIEPDALEDVVPAGPELSGAERLGVYSRMIRLRFEESMDEDFRGVKALVGDERFADLSRRYLLAHPSRSHRLGALGAAFADWLGTEATELEPRAFAAELARVERAILEVYEGPDAERLAVDALLAIPEERWVDVRFSVSPSLRLFACEYPTGRYLDAVFAGESPPVPEPEATFVCVHRTGWRVRRTDLTREEHAVLTALATGAALGDAFESALQLEGADAQHLFASIGDTFRDWTSKELFRSAEL